MKPLALALLLTVSTTFAADTKTYRDATDLWKDFDPRKDPLDAKIISEKKEDGLVLRTVQYTSETVDGFPIRVLAYYGFPAGAQKLPAVIHVHGGGQNAMMEYVKFWAKLGYASMSINWGGKFLEGKEELGKTDYGPVPVNQNDQDSHNVYDAQGHDNSWYRWTAVIRRGVTFLEQQPEVNPQRIGMFGISMGGRLMWLVAGTEPRLRCITAIYGAALMDEPLPGLPDSEFMPAARKNPSWRATLDAYAYAPLIKIPFLYFSTTNDFWSRLDFVDQTMARIPVPSWRCFSLHSSHQVDNPQVPTLTIWMDHWLRDGAPLPASPTIATTLRGSLSATVTPASPNDVTSVRIMYSTDPYPESRFWRTTMAKNQSGRWTSDLPLTVVNQTVHIFANVFYNDGLCLSTPLATVTPRQLVAAKITATDQPSLIIEDFANGYVDWLTPASTNVLLSKGTEFDQVPGPNGGHAIAPSQAGANWSLTTRKIGDPKWLGPAGAALQITLKSEQPNTLAIVVTENDGRLPAKAKKYLAGAQLKGGNTWETVTIPLADFKAIDDQAPLASWEKVNTLAITGRYRIPAKKGPDTYFGNEWQGAVPAVSTIQWKK